MTAPFLQTFTPLKHRRGNLGDKVTSGVIFATKSPAHITLPSQWVNSLSTRQRVYANVLLSQDKTQVAIELTLAKGLNSRTVSSPGYRISVTNLLEEFPGGLHGSQYHFTFHSKSEDGFTAIFNVPPKLLGD